MSKNKNRQQEPVGQNDDVNYTDPLDRDDRQAMKRAEKADDRAPKKDV